MVDEAPRRPKGGQVKDPVSRKSSSVTFRVRDQLKQDLEQSARYHGRSVSEEIKVRLDRSFLEAHVIRNLAQEVKYWHQQAGVPPEQTQEFMNTVAYGSPEAAEAEPGALSRILAQTEIVPRPDKPQEPSTTPPPNWEDTIYRAVVRALRDVRDQDLSGGKP